MPRIFFIGDIVGRPGRSIIKEKLEQIVASENIDIVIANAENAAGGSGLTLKIAEELLGYGIDGITLGDHVWDQKGFPEVLDQLETTSRPANLPQACPGKEYFIIEKDEFKLGVFTVLGRQFVNMKSECPFLASDRIIQEMQGKCDAIFAEIHAEATSEKVALGWHLDGKVAAVVGTHTHIPTADARLLHHGTAYLTDAGMTGPFDSVLGRDCASVVERFLDGMPRRFPVAEGNVQLHGVIIDIDATSGKALTIHRLSVRED